MPVTVHFGASPVVGQSHDRPATGARELLLPCPSRRALLGSVSDADTGTVLPRKNGFVCTVMNAWQKDQHLELRPDDVWLAVLTQFSFYVSGGGDESRAEALRPRFVAHSGCKKLEIIDQKSQSIADIDLPTMVKQFAGLVREKLVDPTLADWLLPVFSTTQPDDEMTAAAAFLGAVKEYFQCRIGVGCGFPSVTLHGQRKDWADLRSRISRLAEFDVPSRTSNDDVTRSRRQPEDASCTSWSRALAKTVDFMVASFDTPAAADVQDFWQRACHLAGPQMSGESTKMSGWLTAFCWWRSDGARLTTYRTYRGERLKLGDVEFPIINQDDIPPGSVWTNVDFILPGGERVDTTLVAGSLGTKLLDESGSRVRPFPSWWLVTGDSTSSRESRERNRENGGPDHRQPQYSRIVRRVSKERASASMAVSRACRAALADLARARANAQPQSPTEPEKCDTVSEE